jgi:hypothetical protein
MFLRDCFICSHIPNSSRLESSRILDLWAQKKIKFKFKKNEKIMGTKKLDNDLMRCLPKLRRLELVQVFYFLRFCWILRGFAS